MGHRRVIRMNRVAMLSVPIQGIHAASKVAGGFRQRGWGAFDAESAGMAFMAPVLSNSGHQSLVWGNHAYSESIAGNRPSHPAAKVSQNIGTR